MTPQELSQSQHHDSADTTQLVLWAKEGDRAAVEVLLQRCLPSLARWAHRHIPPGARGSLDTSDLVQETALHVIGKLDGFTPHHAGAMQAYCRVTLLNRIRDAARSLARRPAPVELLEDIPCPQPSPFESAVQAEAYRRYRQALAKLPPKSRALVIARVEFQWSASEIARRLNMPTDNAARMALTRALRRLMSLLSEQAGERRKV